MACIFVKKIEKYYYKILKDIRIYPIRFLKHFLINITNS